MAQARENLLPPWLANIHPAHKTPAIATLLVGILTMTGILLGRGALLPIVDMGSVCLAVTFVLGFLGVMKLRRAGITAPAGAGVPGGMWVLWLGVVGASVMAIFALAEPVLTGHRTVPIEWILLLAWSVLGALVYRRDDAPATSRAT